MYFAVGHTFGLPSCPIFIIIIVSLNVSTLIQFSNEKMKMTIFLEIFSLGLECLSFSWILMNFFSVIISHNWWWCQKEPGGHPIHSTVVVDETETKSIDGDQMMPPPPLLSMSHVLVACVSISRRIKGKRKKDGDNVLSAEQFFSICPSLYVYRKQPGTHQPSANGHFSLHVFEKKKKKKTTRKERERDWYLLLLLEMLSGLLRLFLFVSPHWNCWVPPFLSHTGTQDDPAKWHPSTFSSSSSSFSIFCRRVSYPGLLLVVWCRIIIIIS